MDYATRHGSQPRSLSSAVGGCALVADSSASTVGQAQQVFLIFTVVPQIFPSQNAKKRETAANLRALTA
jgi:hypothetical protein